VLGARKYEFEVAQNPGFGNPIDDVTTDATAYSSSSNTTYPADTILYWRVRASDENGIGLTWSATFPRQGSGTTPRPWSASVPYTCTIGEPGGLRTDAAPDHVLLSWNQKFGVKQYKLQVSGRPDFATTIENVSTDNAAYAPKLSDVAYMSGNQLYWRVAGVDADNNIGDFSPAQSLSLLPRMRLTVKGSLRKRRRASVSITVKNGRGISLRGVRVRVLGAGLKAGPAPRPSSASRTSSSGRPGAGESSSLQGKPASSPPESPCA
jgi:hypothetical protein